VVSKTYDQDSDADLWRESGFFGKKCTRYLCISKTEGSAGRVVESFKIISEKEQIPGGFSLVTNTLDTGKKIIFHLCTPVTKALNLPITSCECEHPNLIGTT